MLPFSCAICNLLVLLIFCFVALYLYFKNSFKYWQKLGVVHLEPKFPYGNCADSTKRYIPFGVELCKFYNYFKSRGQKYGGIYFFAKPFLIPVCPELVKSVLTKDFSHFFDRGFYHDEENDPLSAHLFALDGQKWKNMRTKLTPTFTSGKLKRMFQTIVNCSVELRDCLNEPIRKGEPVDIKKILIKYTIDVIGSCAFGIECNSFKNPNTDFAKYGERIFKPNATEKIKFLTAFAFPKLIKFLKLKLTNEGVEKFFMALVKDTVDYREQNNVIRNDFMHLLIELKNKGFLENDDNEEELTMERCSTKLTMTELTAQALLFFAAGFETSSTALTWTLFELAQNQEIQSRLRDEIVRVMKQYDGSITYEGLIKMNYLDCVLHESMRKYPPFPQLQRQVTREYPLPGSNVVLAEGTKVIIPVLALHRDPEYYPDPEKFDPERFTPEGRASRPDYSWIPFGEGPRNCIGMRFAMQEMKVGLCQLLINYRFTLNSKTKLPTVFDPNVIVMTATDTIWLDAHRITD